MTACFLKNTVLKTLSGGFFYFKKAPPSSVASVFNSRCLSGVSSSALQLKKRPAKKKPLDVEQQNRPGLYNVVAYATAEEYDLQKLCDGLKRQDLYEPRIMEKNADAVHAVATIKVGEEPREIFFFREGGVVLWNIGDLESSNVLGFLRGYELDCYSERLVQGEAELMNYRHQEIGKSSEIGKDGEILLSTEEPQRLTLDKYTFSNAIALSVKLGVWEATLERYIDSIEFVTEDLRRGKKIRMSREEVLRKQGELFALRHVINLSSDLLDTPDFYWDHDQLEQLYSQTCNYFSIVKRTKVMNEKLNHCVELVELLSSHLSDRHHVRLEWMIIVLIMIEVVFETIHYIDRYAH